MKTIGIDITVLNDENLTGVGVYTYQLIKALLQINRQDKFILFGFSTFTTYNRLKNLEFKNHENVEIKVIKLPAQTFRRLFWLWQKINYPPIEKLIGPVDIYQTFNFYFPPQLGGKSLATVFDLTSILYPEWHQTATSKLDQVRFNRISQKCDLVIAISEHSKKDFLKFSPKSKVAVIYPGTSISLDRKLSQGEVAQVLEKYELKPGYFLSVATLEPRKNLESLVVAFLESNLNQKLVLVGGRGWKDEKLSQLIAENSDKIITTGFVKDEELKVIYSQALGFVYPSFYEGFGIPVLEAMASGIPVICSNTSSLPEVGGRAVYYIDPYKKETILKALIDIAEKPDLRLRLKKAGLLQAKKFSWQKSAQKLNNIYQHL